MSNERKLMQENERLRKEIEKGEVFKNMIRQLVSEHFGVTEFTKRNTVYGVLASGLNDLKASSVDSVPVWEMIRERKRQIEKEGWSIEHDDEHISGQLVLMAAAFLLSHYQQSTGLKMTELDGIKSEVRAYFGDDDWFKPHGSKRDLVRAGALIIAELERLERKGEKQ